MPAHIEESYSNSQPGCPRVRATSSYALMLACPDLVGVLAAVHEWLVGQDCASFGEIRVSSDSDGTLFLRKEFDSTMSVEELRVAFEALARRYDMQWEIRELDRVRLLIVCGGESHLLDHLISRHRHGQLNCDIVGVVSGQEVSVARDIPWFHLPWPSISDEAAGDQLIADQQFADLAKALRADLLALVRFGRRLPQWICDLWYGRIVNLSDRHSLPAGELTCRQALDRGRRRVTASARLVLDALGDGPLIKQESRSLRHLPPDPSEQNLRREALLAEISVADFSLRQLCGGSLFLHRGPQGHRVVAL